MDHVGLDLGKAESQIAIITDAGELVENRMRTERERLRQFFAGRAKARIVIEASMFHATFGYYAQGVSESTAATAHNTTALGADQPPLI